jgi:hypothetical protein
VFLFPNACVPIEARDRTWLATLDAGAPKKPMGAVIPENRKGSALF